MYIDTIVYGFNNDFIKTFVIRNDEGIEGILFHYYDSLQIFICEEVNDNDLNDIASHIKKYDFSMITGNNFVIKRIYDRLNDIYSITDGVIMKYDNETVVNSNRSTLAGIGDYEEIAKLICSDDGIGGHYSVDSLCEQLKEGNLNQNCKSLIIRENGKIICHMATYAESPRLAVLGGLITDVNYRGLGYGRMVLNDMTRVVQSENKIPVLYCYDKNVIDWYSRLGWEIVSTSSKLEKIN